MEQLELKYLKSISTQFPTIAAAATEIINLQAILNLPKGTEHFLTDIHGEYEQFSHILRNGSGSVKRKIEEEFGNTLSGKDKKSLATLIYYPEQKIEQVMKHESDEDLRDWYRVTIHRLIRICRHVSSKYTRSKVRKMMSVDFVYILEELLHEKEEVLDKEAYYNEIINTIVRLERAEMIVIALSDLIKKLVVDHLHIVGDIFDRGSGSAKIMDALLNHHSVDIQWGNHDVVWMGAAAGEEACIANVVRLCAKYCNLDVLEDDYGINLIPLVTFAMETYGDDDCSCFPVDNTYRGMALSAGGLEAKMHKAITVIQFKLEGKIIKSRPDFQMDRRLFLDKMDLESGTVAIDGTQYKLKDTHFPTIDPADPYRLTAVEQDIIDRLKAAFLGCDKLQSHIKFLLNSGSLYLVYNGNLLYHGCIPLNSDGSFRKVFIKNQEYSGKALYDVLESYVRKGYYLPDHADTAEEKAFGKDIMWYIWSSENSPVYGKAKMATFERYLLDDEAMKTEKKDFYYRLTENEDVVTHILKEFGLDPEKSHIINGHMPVQLKKGETPVKCGGKLLIIDGGFSKAYQPKTGIAGYTLIYNSYGLRLVSHEPFLSVEEAVVNEKDILSETVVVEYADKRRHVADTDVGRNMKDKIDDLELLLKAYRTGLIKEAIDI